MAARSCPFCAEEIAEEATRCEHCGSVLTTTAPEIPVQSVPTAEHTSTPLSSQLDGDTPPPRRGWVPGFRTNVWWKKVLAVWGYLMGSLMILMPLFSSENGLRDKITDAFMFSVLILPIFVVTTDFLEARTRLLGKKANSKGMRAMANIGVIFLSFILMGLLNGVHSPEYQARAATAQQEDAKVEEAKKREDTQRNEIARFEAEKKREQKRTDKARAKQERQRVATVEQDTGDQQQTETEAAKADDQQPEQTKNADKTEDRVAAANARQQEKRQHEAEKQATRDQKRQEREQRSAARHEHVAEIKSHTREAINNELHPLEMVDAHVETDEFGIRHIVGTVHNRSRFPYEVVQIEFNIYDVNHTQVKSAFSNVTGLEANGTWKFDAVVLTDVDPIYCKKSDLWGKKKLPGFLGL